jgi:hypothetical protein
MIKNPESLEKLLSILDSNLFEKKCKEYIEENLIQGIELLEEVLQFGEPMHVSIVSQILSQYGTRAMLPRLQQIKDTLPCRCGIHSSYEFLYF